MFINKFDRYKFENIKLKFIIFNMFVVDKRVKSTINEINLQLKNKTNTKKFTI